MTDLVARHENARVKLLLYVEACCFFLQLTVRLPSCNESYGSVIVNLSLTENAHSQTK